MKKIALFEFCVGLIGIILWVLLLLQSMPYQWLPLPFALSGIIVIALWPKRQEFAVPDGFKSSFKKNNIISLILTIFIVVISLISIGFQKFHGHWDVWVYYVVYVLLFAHGGGLYSSYQWYEHGNHNK